MAKLEKNQHPEANTESVEIVGVTFREAGKVYYFSPGILKLSAGEHVIVDTARGTEIGLVKLGNKLVPQDSIVAPLKTVKRVASASDLERDAKNRELEFDAAIICKKKIEEHKLGMKLVAAEYTFDNSKLIFYFTCESRVDFRELVKDLAATFKTRIELRQIGIRDETKMIGGLAVCGRKYCCAGFLQDFVQVSIKMAREQNFALNSSKSSGACGRLMCCLRYEYDTYEEAIKKLPPQGSIVATPDGKGVVTELRPLAEEVKVRIEDKEKEKESVKIFPAKEVKLIKAPQKKKDHGKNEEE